MAVIFTEECRGFFELATLLASLFPLFLSYFYVQINTRSWKRRNPVVALGLLQHDQSCQICSCRRFFYLCVFNGSYYSVLWRYHLTVKARGCGWHGTCGCLDYCLRCQTCQDSKSWFGSCPADFYKSSVGGQKPRLSELCYAINCFSAEVSNPISAVFFFLYYVIKDKYTLFHGVSEKWRRVMSTSPIRLVCLFFF